MNKNSNKCRDHEWDEMHHYDDCPETGKLIHYCPTGFKQCNKCGMVDVLSDIERPTCFKWGKP